MFKYNYQASVKSKIADELLNTYFIRPFAGIFVNLLYDTKIKPIEVVIFGSILGFISAIFFAIPGYNNLFIGAVFLFAKNISDAVDGQLARAKNMVDRRGRFLDSIADIIINFFVFIALSYPFYLIDLNWRIFIIGFAAFISLTFRVSYFVFYEVTFLKYENKMSTNRIIETVTEEDKKGDKIALVLQNIFNILYTWQDKLVYKIDQFCKPGEKRIEDIENFDFLWYSNKLGLRLGNFIGLGTELTFLIIMCFLDRVLLYFFINVCFLNLYLLFIIFYRKLYLSHKIIKQLKESREK
jgi:phosphatidylglycerophosphate synthase